MKFCTAILEPHVLLARPMTDASPTSPPATQVAQDKIEAYRVTHYRVLAPEPITLRIGAENADVQAAMQRHGTSSFAFITAFNPAGQAIAERENLRRHAALLQDLARLRCVFFEGDGCDPHGDWPAEQSCLCFGLSLDQACELGLAYGQDAIVHGASDGVPQLVLLR